MERLRQPAEWLHWMISSSSGREKSRESIESWKRVRFEHASMIVITGLLVHVILTGNIVTVDRLIGIPEKQLAELCGVVFSKNVVVGDNAPYG